jgi:hypothetical protein
VSDYISILLRTIDKTQNDPARLRTLVYDIARLSLGKHVLLTYQQIGSAGLQQHIADLETAISHVEDISQKQLEDLSHKAPSPEQKEAVADLAAQLLDGQVSALDRNGLTVRDSFDEDMFEERKSSKAAVVVHPLPTEIYAPPPAEILQPLQYRVPAFGSGPKHRQPDASFGMQLVIATLIGIAIYVASIVGFDYVGSRSSIQGSTEALATAAKPVSAAVQALGAPLPTVYGVYAVSEGKLYELDPLPLKVPDARVAISALISMPSNVTLPSGKVQFILFRRDLVSSAPTEVFVRVIARVTRETKFNEAGSPSTSNVEGEWAVRSKSYVFRVAPLGENPEMVTLRPANPEQSLSPGRYALVLAGKGYDFTIEGQVTDAAQCLERTNVVGGIVYSECRGAPTPLAN